MKNIKCSVCITRSYEDDNLFLKALKSLEQQQGIKLHIYILDQKKSQTIKKYAFEHSNKSHSFHYHTIPPMITSKARNKGIELAQKGIMLTTDPDCICDSHWAYELVTTLITKKACIVGGKISPVWEINPPIFVKSKYLKEFYSVLDLGESQKKISKVLTANFAVNVDVLKQERVFFNSKTGRTNKNLLGGEDTQLCYDITQKGYTIYYTGKAVVNHIIQKEKLTYSWLFKRVFYGGMSKVQRKQYKIEPFNERYNIYDIIFLTMIMPVYIIGYVKGIVLFNFKR